VTDAGEDLTPEEELRECLGQLGLSDA